jgi:hypothetical protein
MFVKGDKTVVSASFSYVKMQAYYICIVGGFQAMASVILRLLLICPAFIFPDFPSHKMSGLVLAGNPVVMYGYKHEFSDFCVQIKKPSVPLPSLRIQSVFDTS